MFMREKIFFIISFLLSFIVITAFSMTVTSFIYAVIIGLLATLLGGFFIASLAVAGLSLIIEWAAYIARSVFLRIRQARA
jgi:hypothetical protein